MLNKKSFSLLVLFLMVSLFLSFFNLFGQTKKLTYQQVYQRAEPRLTASLPDIKGWLDDSHYLEMKQHENNSTSKLMKVEAESGQEAVFFDFGAYADKLPKGFSLRRADAHNEDYTHFIFDSKNDLYFFSTRTGEFKRLTANPASENNPTLSPNGKWIAFTRDHNLFALDLETGLEHQLTTDGSDVVYNGWASWVYYEEILGRGSRYAAFWWSPKSDKIAFLRFDDSSVPKFPLYRADDVHGELEFAHYPKAGDPNPDVKLGIIQLTDDRTVWVEAEGDSKQYIAWPFWSPDGKYLFFQWLDRGQDDLIIYSANPENGKITKIYQEKQDTWVDWFDYMYFMKDNSGFIFRSDRDGWPHFYYYDLTGHQKAQLTKGNWRARDIAMVDENNKKIYFRRSLGNALETHLYCVDLTGKNMKRLTTVQGNHRINMSPGGSYFIDSYSNIYAPSKMDICSANGKTLRNLGDQKLPIMDEYERGKVELFTIPTGDGYDLPAIWVLPPDFDASKKYPVLFNIYGGPASGSVSNSYLYPSWYYLAQNGIIVMSVDHRGSGHFGKKGEAQMFRNLGKWEMEDYISAVKWLREKPFIDANRVGITGGSYGGYATCMALTYASDYFTHGVAHFSVTDWKLYDSIYTERYMDTPDENPEGYKFGSVLTHADKYKGNLLITHGTMDDNVHLQNTIQFIEKLEDLDKDFELMLYPNSRHGVGGSKRAHFSREDVQFWFRHFLGKELDTDID